MNNKSKALMIIASLILILTFFFPIWSIELQAPQYPEGLGLKIWINEVSGLNEHDLQNINGLNHYIGMKPILPETIPELKVIPYIFVFMILFGITIAFIGKKVLIKLWISLFLILSVVGLVDFYLWGYDYGHDLNPNAPIKVPNLTYQPPLIGSKQLLNINAVSLPDVGTYCIILSLAIAGFVLYRERSLRKPKKSKDSQIKNIVIAGLFISGVGFGGCQSEPEPIEYGMDSCDNCKMLITDSRYGSELITEKGKVLKFDAVECLGEFIIENQMEENTGTKLFISDFFNPGEFIDARGSYYLHNDNFRSPMGMNVLATADSIKLREFHNEHKGELLDWRAVIKIVKADM